MINDAPDTCPVEDFVHHEHVSVFMKSFFPVTKYRIPYSATKLFLLSKLKRKSSFLATRLLYFGSRSKVREGQGQKRRSDDDIHHVMPMSLK